MKDRLIELIGGLPFSAEYEKYNSVEWAEHLADYLLANGVIVPPCKVGDKVWTSARGKIVSNEVFNIKFECQAENHGVFIRERITMIGEHSMTIDFCDIGKSVFLTKEEAEKAMKGGAE